MRRSVRIAAVPVAVALLCCAGLVPAGAADEPPPPVEIPADVDAGVWGADAWGVDDVTTLRVHASEFRPQNASTTTSSFWNTGITYISNHLAFLHAPLLLPAGAEVTSIGFDGYDIDPSLNINWGIYWVTTATSDSSGNLGWWVTSASGGYFSGTATLGTPHVVTTDRYYFFLVDPNKLGQDMRIKGMRVSYRLQVSPAPAVATFGDVGIGHWAFRHVEALAASGITAGCGGGNFCPDSAVSRAEMAVFLAKALGLHHPG